MERLIREHLAGKRIVNTGENRNTLRDYARKSVEENSDYFDSQLADKISKIKRYSKLNVLILPLLEARARSLPTYIKSLEQKRNIAIAMKDKKNSELYFKQIQSATAELNAITTAINNINNRFGETAKSKIKTDRQVDATRINTYNNFRNTLQIANDFLSKHKDVRAKLFRECYDPKSKTFDRNKYEQLLGNYFLLRQSIIQKPNEKNALLKQAREQSSTIYSLLTNEFGLPIPTPYIKLETTPTIKDIAIEPELKLEPTAKPAEIKSYKQYVDPRIRNQYYHLVDTIRKIFDNEIPTEIINKFEEYTNTSGMEKAIKLLPHIILEFIIRNETNKAKNELIGLFNEYVNKFDVHVALNEIKETINKMQQASKIIVEIKLKDPNYKPNVDTIITTEQLNKLKDYLNELILTEPDTEPEIEIEDIDMSETRTKIRKLSFEDFANKLNINPDDPASKKLYHEQYENRFKSNPELAEIWINTNLPKSDEFFECRNARVPMTLLSNILNEHNISQHFAEGVVSYLVDGLRLLGSKPSIGMGYKGITSGNINRTDYADIKDQLTKFLVNQGVIEKHKSQSDTYSLVPNVKNYKSPSLTKLVEWIKEEAKERRGIK